MALVALTVVFLLVIGLKVINNFKRIQNESSYIAITNYRKSYIEDLCGTGPTVPAPKEPEICHVGKQKLM